jgi:DNA-binding FadR family transcriptional regulator
MAMSAEDEQRVLEHLRRLIRMGHYPEHSKLPSERELAAALSAGRHVLRRALAILEAEGRIRRHVGQGTFVGGRAPDPLAGEAPLPPLRARSPAELIEARLLIEPRLAALAAARANAEDIDYLRLCLAKSASAPDWYGWERWDGTFHRTVALASQNALLGELVEHLNKLRKTDDWVRLRKSALDEAWRTRLVAEHRAIVDAIARRDARAAARAMHAHLAGVETRLLRLDEDFEREATADPHARDHAASGPSRTRSPAT